MTKILHTSAVVTATGTPRAQLAQNDHYHQEQSHRGYNQNKEQNQATQPRILDDVSSLFLEFNFLSQWRSCGGNWWTCGLVEHVSFGSFALVVFHFFGEFCCIFVCVVTGVRSLGKTFVSRVQIGRSSADAECRRTRTLRSIPSVFVTRTRQSSVLQISRCRSINVARSWAVDGVRRERTLLSVERHGGIHLRNTSPEILEVNANLSEILHE